MSKTERSRTPQGRGGRLRRALAHYLWGPLGFALGIVGLVLTLLIANGDLFPPSTVHLLQIGQAGQTGPLTMTPSRVVCGKHLSDASRSVRGIIPPTIHGQLCFVHVRVYNSSHIQTPAAGFAKLVVTDKEYIDATTDPAAPPLLFPGEKTSVTVIFNIPGRVLPTRLILQGLSPFKPPSRGKPVTYDLQPAGAVAG